MMADRRRLDGAPERSAVGRIAAPDEIPPGDVFLASDEAAFITGQVIFADGGASVGI